MHVRPKTELASSYVLAREHLNHEEACAVVAQACDVAIETVEAAVADAKAKVGEELA